ncbi:hypothetical protein [Luteimicrobium subarcticum]|uniref:Uncharacterized protein n=1 Tax=Luteimicrobium subarcticum TaxID=620910 RepID=A0A2M8WUI2_9MICO|nr:hypothetical protein [Luteimicrobium subarcticum]PJI94583.1 hypothetical protein CLV34_0427 [Luteimicrobium subarcticum]
MSTLPGDDSLRDAGLEPVGTDAVVHAAQEPSPDADVLDEADYQPSPGLPDPDREADDADVVEQADEVRLEDPDEL